MSTKPLIEYIPDVAVDAKLDRQLRDLLSVCFVKPVDNIFTERRFFREPPEHRWLVRDDSGRPIAQVAVHEKAVMHEWRRLPIGGVAEVCVHPDCRGRGLVRHVMAEAHDWLAARKFLFAMLFGKPEVYTSSGYSTVSNVWCEEYDATGMPHRKQLTPMVRALGSEPWPVDPVLLPGLTF
jgi:hypothetical protein